MAQYTASNVSSSGNSHLQIGPNTIDNSINDSNNTNNNENGPFATETINNNNDNNNNNNGRKWNNKKGRRGRKNKQFQMMIPATLDEIISYIFTKIDRHQSFAKEEKILMYHWFKTNGNIGRGVINDKLIKKIGGEPSNNKKGWFINEINKVTGQIFNRPYHYE